MDPKFRPTSSPPPNNKHYETIPQKKSPNALKISSLSPTPTAAKSSQNMNLPSLSTATPPTAKFSSAKTARNVTASKTKAPLSALTSAASPKSRANISSAPFSIQTGPLKPATSATPRPKKTIPNSPASSPLKLETT